MRRPLCTVVCLAAAATAYYEPSNLKVEYLKAPLGVDVDTPRFSWEVSDASLPRGGGLPSAYQIVVSRVPDTGARLRSGSSSVWDSGVVGSNATAQVLYGGPSLVEGAAYQWTVAAWDADGTQSTSPTLATFETGLRSETEWKGADWLGGANMLRAEFTLASDYDGSASRARLYVSGLGYQIVEVNGQRSTESVLGPGWATYSVRSPYEVQDVSALLRPGANAVGIMLGTGPLRFWSGDADVRVRCQLRVDGVPVMLSSAANGALAKWYVKGGPVVADDVYDGETYDARLEVDGWSSPGAATGDWDAPAVLQALAGRGTEGSESWAPEGPTEMRWHAAPAEQVVERLVPFTVDSPKAGVFVFDLGQNIAGYARLSVRGTAGTAVTIKYAEALSDDGTVNRGNLGNARSEDVYVLRGGSGGGGSAEEYEPRFTWHGFRYVQLEGYPGVPTVDAVRGCVVRANTPQVGGFASSSQLLNKLQRAAVWSLADNLHSALTSCTQRDERTGWTQDVWMGSEGWAFNFNAAPHLYKYVHDLADLVGANGTLPDVAPYAGSGPGRRPSDPAWALPTFVEISHLLYDRYGDVRVLQELYAPLQQAVAYVANDAAKTGVEAMLSYYGDWVAIENAPGAFVSAATLHQCLLTMAKISAAVGDASATYGAQADALRTAIAEAYLVDSPGSALYQGQEFFCEGEQDAQAMALTWGLIEGGRDKDWGATWRAVIERLRINVQYAQNTKVTGGFLGVRATLEAVGANMPELAFELISGTDYPSFGGMVEAGATTMWEVWALKVGNGMNSHNHVALSYVSPWLSRVFAGLFVEYRKVTVRPNVVPGLAHAAASAVTGAGAAAAGGYRIDGDAFHITATIPGDSAGAVYVQIPQFETSATVTVTEAVSGAVVWQDGAYVAGAEGVNGGEAVAAYLYQPATILFDVGDGAYEFVVARAVAAGAAR